MQCKKCGHENRRPLFEYVLFDIAELELASSVDVLSSSAPVRWHCDQCGQPHFRDGSIYDHARALKMARGEA